MFTSATVPSTSLSARGRASTCVLLLLGVHDGVHVGCILGVHVGCACWVCMVAAGSVIKVGACATSSSFVQGQQNVVLKLKHVILCTEDHVRVCWTSVDFSFFFYFYFY